MNCGSPVRPPPRRPAATGRLVGLVCLLLLAAAFWAGPAGASYACKDDVARTHSMQVSGESCVLHGRTRGDADAMSFVFFIGILIAVVLIPVFKKREDAGPE